MIIDYLIFHLGVKGKNGARVFIEEAVVAHVNLEGSAVVFGHSLPNGSANISV